MYHSGNELLNPQLLFEKAQLHSGMHVADLGCGRTGHIVFPAAAIIGDHGMIYAVDIMKDVLENIIKRARMENLLNIHTVWSDIEKVGKTAIPKKSLDVVFLVNILFHTDKIENMLDEAHRLLKDKSRIIVVDWIKNSLPFGPKEDKLIDFTKITTWSHNNNIVVQEEFKAGKYHKGLVLYKAN